MTKERRLGKRAFAWVAAALMLMTAFGAATALFVSTSQGSSSDSGFQPDSGCASYATYATEGITGAYGYAGGTSPSGSTIANVLAVDANSEVVGQIVFEGWLSSQLVTVDNLHVDGVLATVLNVTYEHSSFLNDNETVALFNASVATADSTGYVSWNVTLSFAYSYNVLIEAEDFTGASAVDGAGLPQFFAPAGNDPLTPYVTGAATCSATAGFYETVDEDWTGLPTNMYQVDANVWQVAGLNTYSQGRYWQMVLTNGTNATGGTVDSDMLGISSMYGTNTQSWTEYGFVTLSYAAPPTPNPPTDLVVSDVLENQAMFTWDQSTSPSIVNNTLYVFAGSGCSGTAAFVFSVFGAGSPVSSTDGGFAAGTSYSAYVTAWNGMGQSGASNCVDFTTQSPPPDAPTYLTLDGVTTTTASFNWTQSATLGAYQPTWGFPVADSHSWGGFVAFATGEAFVYGVEGSSGCGTNTAWQYGDNGSSSSAALTNVERDFFTQALTDAGAFVIGYQTPGTENCGPNPIIVNVTAGMAYEFGGFTASPAGGQVEMGNNTLYTFAGTGCTGALVTTVNTNGPAIVATVTGLVEATSYSSYVTAWNANDSQSGPSNCVNFDTLGLPHAPTYLTVFNITENSASFNWTQSTSPDIVNDTLYVFGGSGCSGVWLYIISTVGAATEANLTMLYADTMYSAYVTAWNSEGQSPASNCVDFTTSTVIPPLPSSTVCNVFCIVMLLLVAAIATTLFLLVSGKRPDLFNKGPPRARIPRARQGRSRGT